MIGINISLHFEDEPMLCRECCEPMNLQSMVMQIGSADMGNITPIEGLCESCTRKSSQTPNPDDQKSTDNK
jgi:hypothetical protein